jgi:NTP pyrophosphatase (non-canonical NTP hydrolase)
MTYLEDILTCVIAERDRQEHLLISGKFKWTCADPTVGNLEKLAVLAEEFGEVARVVCEESCNDKSDIEHLKEELIQVAAVCVAWVEGL